LSCFGIWFVPAIRISYLVALPFTLLNHIVSAS
jgi:hypothetical protein